MAMVLSMAHLQVSRIGSVNTLRSLRQIEHEEDARARLEQLRERFGIVLRRQGLGSALDAKVGESPLPGIMVIESRDGGAWWLAESE